MEEYFVGTELKVAYKIEREGFDMETDDWTATVKKGSKSIVCNKTTNSAHHIDGWFLLVDSRILGSGKYELVTDIDVPDVDFPDGLRHETYKQELFVLNGV